MARAYNDWTLDVWVRPHPEFKGSIIVNPQDPEFSVAEIERLADDPGIVQVLIFSGSNNPYGQPRFFPIWEAAARYGLPVAMHTGGETVGLAPSGTPAGPVSYYVEHHALQLGRRGSRAPEDGNGIERGGEQLGEDARA